MGDHHMVHRPILQEMKRRKRSWTILIWIHPRIQHDTRPGYLKVMTRGSDFTGITEGEVLHAENESLEL
jgi:hypothetical protein